MTCQKPRCQRAATARVTEPTAGFVYLYCGSHARTALPRWRTLRLASGATATIERLVRGKWVAS